MSSSFSNLRYPRIDGLRCVAIALVLFEHFGWRGESILPGYYGVDLFFVISGFLITGILLKSHGVSLRGELMRFMGRRALRIFPPYYLLLLILVISDVAPARELWVSLFTYTFNYAAPVYNETQASNPLFYLWSLSLEEQFYLVWPFLILWLRPCKAAVVALVAAVVVLGYAQNVWNIVPAAERFSYTGLFNRMGSLGLGALGAVYLTWWQVPRFLFTNRWVEICGLGLVGIAICWDFPLRFILMGCGSLFLVIKAAQFEFQTRWIDRLLTNSRVTYVGMISYGIYLFHVPLGNALTAHFFDPVWKAIPFAELGALEKIRWHSWVVKLPLYTGASIALAAVSHRWFEAPIMELKKRWFP